jgi:alpha-glucosidase (family GH31 glycosyl hydrolase)
MEYPKSWEQDVQNWMNDPGEPESYIVTNEDDGLKVHKVKNVNWLATAKANWKALTAAAAALVLFTGALIWLLRRLTRE